MAERQTNPERLNIGLYSPYLMTTEGGVQENVRQSAINLREFGHNVTIFGPKDPHSRYNPDNAVYLGVANRHTKNDTHYFSAWRPVSYKTIDALHNGFDLDVAHYHEPELSFPSLQDLMTSKATNIVTFHAYNEIKFNPVFFAVSRLRFILGRKVHGRILVSDALEAYAKHYFPGHFDVIPNGVDTNRFNPNVEKIKEYDDDKINILFVGRLEERKNVSLLLDAYKQVKARADNTRLIVVGSGPLGEELRQKALSENLEVCFEGRVADEKLPSYFATADIFTSPPTSGESFGLVLLEAMASGLPVVPGDNPGYKTVVTGEEGIVVDPRDTGMYAAALLALANSEQERKDRGAVGLKKAQQFAWPKVTKTLESYYIEKLIEREAKRKKRKQVLV